MKSNFRILIALWKHRGYLKIETLNLNPSKVLKAEVVKVRAGVVYLAFLNLSWEIQVWKLSTSHSHTLWTQVKSSGGLLGPPPQVSNITQRVKQKSFSGYW